jgi:hypothetical protein
MNISELNELDYKAEFMFPILTGKNNSYLCNKDGKKKLIKPGEKIKWKVNVRV